MAYIITCIYFYLPAALANIGANIGKFIPIFRDIKIPLDLGIKINGERMVGEHKLVGSFLFGVIFGTIAGQLKYILVDPLMRDYLLLDLTWSENLILYGLMSTMALVGDVIKSVAKRLLKIKPHSAWVPFDEVDHSVTSLLVAGWFFSIPIEASTTIVLTYFFLHVAANWVGYKIGIKKVPY